MAVAQEELHHSLKRVRVECTRVKRKLEESVDKGERKKVKAVARAQVIFFCPLTRMREALAIFVVALFFNKFIVIANAQRHVVHGIWKAYWSPTRLIARSYYRR